MFTYKAIEEEDTIIFNMLEQGDIKIEKIYGLDNNLDFSEINQTFYKNKYSMLVLNKNLVPNMYVNREKNKLLEFDVNSSSNLLRILF